MPPPLTFDLESGVRVTCNVCYLCANFSLPILDLGPMYATVVRRASSLNAPYKVGAGVNNFLAKYVFIDLDFEEIGLSCIYERDQIKIRKCGIAVAILQSQRPVTCLLRTDF